MNNLKYVNDLIKTLWSGLSEERAKKRHLSVIITGGLVNTETSDTVWVL